MNKTFLIDLKIIVDKDHNLKKMVYSFSLATFITAEITIDFISHKNLSVENFLTTFDNYILG